MTLGVGRVVNKKKFNLSRVVISGNVGRVGHRRVPTVEFVLVWDRQ